WSQVTPGLTVNVRTVVTDPAGAEDTPTPERRASTPPATGIALDVQPPRPRRSGELTSPRLPIPPQPPETERGSALADQPVPPAPPPPPSPKNRDRPTARPPGAPPRVDDPKPVPPPLPQAPWPGITEPLPEESAPRRQQTASQEPNERWTPVWDSLDEEDT